MTDAVISSATTRVLEVIREESGITRRALAEQLQIKQNYFDWALPQLCEMGLIEEREGQWHIRSGLSWDWLNYTRPPHRIPSALYSELGR